MKDGLRNIIDAQNHQKSKGGERIGPNEYLVTIRHPTTYKEMKTIVKYDPKTGRRVPPPVVPLPKWLLPPKLDAKDVIGKR